jgi:hypothetical protein
MATAPVAHPLFQGCNIGHSSLRPVALNVEPATNGSPLSIDHLSLQPHMVTKIVAHSPCPDGYAAVRVKQLNACFSVKWYKYGSNSKRVSKRGCLVS